MQLPFPLVEEPDDVSCEKGRKLFVGSNADFLKGVVAMSGLPGDDRVEVCFAGRSNVGKSSLINALLNRKKLAKASAEPGRTRQLNYFDVAEGQLYLVDLPGYGYARASKSEIAQWTKLTMNYLQGRPTLKRIFMLIDARHGVKSTDEEVMDILDSAAVVYQIVLTKLDKLKKSDQLGISEQVVAKLKKRPAFHPVVIETSSVDGIGLPELKAEIASLI